jgi:uncharacterized OsmC-like protein
MRHILFNICGIIFFAIRHAIRLVHLRLALFISSIRRTKPRRSATRKNERPAETGGDGSKACSADMLMEALAACANVTLKAVATAMRIPLKHARVVANGTWDARGTLAVDRDTPVGLTEVKLQFEIDSTAERKKLEKMIELTERYCVIYQTLAKPPTLESEFEVL